MSDTGNPTWDICCICGMWIVNRDNPYGNAVVWLRDAEKGISEKNLIARMHCSCVNKRKPWE